MSVCVYVRIGPYEINLVGKGTYADTNDIASFIRTHVFLYHMMAIDTHG